MNIFIPCIEYFLFSPLNLLVIYPVDISFFHFFNVPGNELPTE